MSDELRLRRLLCIARHGRSAYLDDGEASDASEHPSIDYLRDSLDEIEAKWMQRARAKVDAPPATSDPGPWPATGLEPRGCPIPGACACPPATSAELVALIEAVDTLLESAPCECPHRMREERGEHLSHCYLFDLNVARSGAGEKR